jgi:hypothetical protein
VNRDSYPPAPPTIDQIRVAFGNAPREPKRSRVRVVVAIALVGAVFLGGAVFVWAGGGADPRSPEPSAQTSPGVAPTDEAVQTELDAQLAIFAEQGGTAANERLKSYKAKFSACDVTLGALVGKPYSKTAVETALQAHVDEITAKASSSGVGMTVRDNEIGFFDGFVLIVVCPPVAA